VDTEFGSEKEFFCIECLLNIDNPADKKTLKPIDQFVDSAAEFYAQNRKRIEDNVETPSEYLDILSKQQETLETMTEHIEGQKQKVQSKFDEMTQNVMKMINQKREEYFQMLDQQLFNLRYSFIFFEKQLRKSFPKQDDLSLYPTKDELVSKLGKIQNSTQLTAFFKTLKEDINEHKMVESLEISLTPEEMRRALIINSTKKINEALKKKPTIIDTEADQEKILETLQEQVDKAMDGLFDLQDSIEDIATGDNFPKSALMKPAEFRLFKKWLPKEYANKKVKLIYSGKKDGYTASAFHQKVNGKGATISVMKSKTYNKVFGGFLDKDWGSSNSTIQSDKVFLFSITNKEKYTANGNNQYGVANAANGGMSYGPVFGAGNDVYVSTNMQTQPCYANMSTFNYKSAQHFSGNQTWYMEDIEVFSVGK
jgi:hypothetical protein